MNRKTHLATELSKISPLRAFKTLIRNESPVRREFTSPIKRANREIMIYENTQSAY